MQEITLRCLWRVDVIIWVLFWQLLATLSCPLKFLGILRLWELLSPVKPILIISGESRLHHNFSPYQFISHSCAQELRGLRSQCENMLLSPRRHFSSKVTDITPNSQDNEPGAMTQCCRLTIVFLKSAHKRQEASCKNLKSVMGLWLLDVQKWIYFFLICTHWAKVLCYMISLYRRRNRGLRVFHDLPKVTQII